MVSLNMLVSDMSFFTFSMHAGCMKVDPLK